jgi:hypothetical protein
MALRLGKLEKLGKLAEFAQTGILSNSAKSSRHAMSLTAATILALLLSSACLETSALPPNPLEKGIVLEQQGTVAGKQTICITPHAVRIDSKERGVVTVSTAPDWQITIYNPSMKKYYVTAIAKYRGMLTHVFLFYGIDASAFSLRTVRKESILGHPCSVLQPIGKSSEDTWMGSACTNFWVAEGLNVAKEGTDIIAKQLCIPQSHKLPVRFDYLQGTSSTHALETVKWSTTSVSKDFFTLPAGYTKTARESDVYMQE